MGTGEVFPVVGKGVNGGVVDAGLDTSSFHVVLEGGTAVSLGKEDGGQMAGRNTRVPGEGQDDFCGEVCPVMGDDFTAALVPSGEFFELLDSQCSPDFVDAVVVAQLDDVVGVSVAGVPIISKGGHAVRAQEFEPGSEFLGMGGEHAAFSRSQVFVGEEGEAADIAPGAKGFALQAGSRTVSGVFDDVEVVLTGEIEDGRHIAGITAVVHDDDGFGARGDAGRNGGRGDGEVVGAGDIGEDNAGAGVEDGVGGGDEGEGGEDDFVPGANAKGNAGEMQGFGGVGDGEAVGAAGQLGEVVFEVGGDFAHGEPFGMEDREDGVVFI